MIREDNGEAAFVPEGESAEPFHRCGPASQSASSAASAVEGPGGSPACTNRSNYGPWSTERRLTGEEEA